MKVRVTTKSALDKAQKWGFDVINDIPQQKLQHQPQQTFAFYDRVTKTKTMGEVQNVG